jgi:hypothetical protein
VRPRKPHCEAKSSRRSVTKNAVKPLAQKSTEEFVPIHSELFGYLGDDTGERSDSECRVRRNSNVVLGWAGPCEADVAAGLSGDVIVESGQKL